MTYKIINIDLSIPRINEVYNLSGDSIKVINATSDCFIQFDDTTQDPINLLLVGEIKIKFKKFYISNVGIKDQSIKIVVSEDFSLYDRIGISKYIPEPIPKPIHETAQIINITNSEPNVQIELDLIALNFDNYNDVGGNIRIIDINHKPIPFYLDSFDKTTKTGKLFLKTPTNIIKAAIIYPDVLDAPSLSDGNIFEFFDDFIGTNIDPTKWNIVDDTGWSVGNGELRGSNTTGRLLTWKLFSSGVILEIKARALVPTIFGYTIGSFWVDTSNGFVFQHQSRPLDLVFDYVRTDTMWHHIGDIIPEGIDILQQFVVHPTTVNLKVTRLDTNAVIHNTNYTNSVVNEPIMLGRRPDNTLINRSYETFWDWVRVRKVTGATAVII